MSMDWMRDMVVKTADEAVDLMFNQGKKTVILYNSCSKTLSVEIRKFYGAIKHHNSKIDDINQQILPTNPYYWNDIDGCLAVECAEISGGTFADNAGNIAMFSGWNYGVLTDISARKPVSEKAQQSLAMFGWMATS